MGSTKAVLVCASNLGVWGEELQAPWDALRKAGHDLTLATPQGKLPLPLTISVDPEFVDPLQNYRVNPPEVCDRVQELVRGDEWASPIRIADARMADYDAIVLCGGLGAMLDIANNKALHALLLEATRTDKLIGALCYSIGALVFCRDPDNDHASIIAGKTITAHPRDWDFTGDCSYELWGATGDNAGTDAVTTGFLFPLQDIAIDAVGPDGRVSSDPKTNRDAPDVQFDWPFVTGCSVESSIAYGQKLIEVLSMQLIDDAPRRATPVAASS